MAMVAIRLDEERVKKLDEIARSFDGNRSAVLRRLIDESAIPEPPLLLRVLSGAPEKPTVGSN